MASFSSKHKAPARIPTGALSGATIEETTVSFGFPPVCNDRFNYRRDSAIYLLCGGNRLFDTIDQLQYITALLLFFRLFTLHSCSSSDVLARRSFPSGFFPPFCLFRSESEAMRES
jgi:hypothetical protein